MSEPDQRRQKSDADAVVAGDLTELARPPAAPQPPAWRSRPPSVGTVLVTHNGSTWLPRVLASLVQLTHGPSVWRAVDVASADTSRSLVVDAFGAQRVLDAPSGAGFGAAVALGVDALPKTDWIWLLHDDATVEPGALAGLLDVATSSDDIAIVGPKVREWPSLRTVVEVGATVSGSGHRVTGVDSSELDAGQHDRSRDVLAVGTAGMLIRRHAWEALGGFDAQFPMYFDDIDLGWRAARAGYRVRTAPGSVLFHAAATRHAIRPRARGDQPRYEMRRAAIWAQLVNSGPLRFWWQYVRLLVAGFARTVGFIAIADPDSAGDEIQALGAAYSRPLRMFAARRRRARASTRSARAVRPLLAPVSVTYQHVFETFRAAATTLTRPETVHVAGLRSANPEHQRNLDSPETSAPPHRSVSWLRQRPWFVVAASLFAFASLAGRSLWAGLSNQIGGGALPLAPDSVSQWWGLLLSGERPLGMADGSGPLFVLPLALVSLPVWSQPSALITVVMIFAVPLAALTAHRLGRLLTAQRLPRTVWAVSYAALVTGVGAVPQGRFGSVVALVLAPVIANQTVRLIRNPGVRIAIRLGFAIAVAGAFAPIMILLVTLALIVALAIGRGGGFAAVLLAAGVAAVLLGPWLVERLRPDRWWWEAGFAAAGTADVVDVIGGRAGSVSAPPWLSIGLLALAIAAFIPRRSRLIVAGCWAFALVCLGLAVVGLNGSVVTASGRAASDAWVGIPAVLWLASLSTAALLGWAAWLEQSRESARSIALAVLVVALILPVATCGWWLIRGSDEPVRSDPESAIPQFLVDLPGYTLNVRSPGGSMSVDDYEVVRGAGDFLGSEALVQPAADRAELTVAVQNLMSGASEEDVSVLRDAGISAIYLPRAVDFTDVEAAINRSPGIDTTGSDTAEASAWMIAEPASSKPVDVAPLARWISTGSVVVWMVALLAMVPIRRRRETNSA